MTQPTYAITKQFPGTFQEALTKIRQSLINQGFGILTEIDVKQTLKKKLSINYSQYLILGACNPPNAYKALQAEIEIGLLLPCNLIIYEKNKKIYISAVKPTIALTISKNKQLLDIAKTIEEKLKQAVITAIHA